MDDYSTDLDMDGDTTDDVWAGEENVFLIGIPDQLWSVAAVEYHPEVPEPWLNKLADRVEIQRLCQMKVLVPAAEFQGEVPGILTTKFVRDWRLKEFGEGAEKRKRWMRRSRFVAREFANSRRLDTFSPATGAHTANLLPFKYLWMKGMTEDMGKNSKYSVIMAALDVRDAFLQVEQDEPILVHLQGEAFIIKPNLPGQRLGAKQWYLHLKAYLSESLGFTFCPEQSCLARTKDATILIHVDDILYVGTEEFWENTFLKGMKEKFTVSHEQLTGPGSSIKFLRRSLTEVDDGLVLMPGTTVEKVVESFEKVFGYAKLQKIPSDTGIQVADNSPRLSEKDSSAFRSVIGLCLYVGRERPDLMYTIKELASCMSAPTVAALGRLRKMIGFMKQAGDIGVKKCIPQPGVGKTHKGGETEWVLESYSDADWSANKTTRRSTSSGVHFMNNCFIFASSGNQKVVSLSSCESELHSLVSCACDGLFIKACAMFILDGLIEHLQYTDSSSAHQLASRQGCGRVRHVSGKLLWIQEKTADGSFSLQPVATVYNIADIGAKTLNRQRLFFLLHDCGLVYGSEFSAVGEHEFAMVNEKIIGSQQLKKVAKAILKIGLAMGISEGLGPTGAMAQQCSDVEKTSNTGISFMVVCIVSGVLLFMVVAACWRKVERLIEKFEREVSCLESELQSVQEQLADHYEYAGDLWNRMDASSARTGSIETSRDVQAANIRTFQEEQEEMHGFLEEAIDCLRFGLMEIGGFVRFTSLDRQQRAHMFTQERANLVIWNLRNRAETTDPHDPNASRDGEGEEEEPQTEDPTVEPPVHSPGQIEALLENMRRDQNIALANERWLDASQIQSAISTILDATAGDNLEMLSTSVIRDIRNTFQRLFRTHRNRGSDERMERFRVYVEDMTSLMT